MLFGKKCIYKVKFNRSFRFYKISSLMGERERDFSFNRIEHLVITG